jgi:hypothetical protein
MNEDAQRIEQAVSDFLCDPRAIRYLQGQTNENLLLDFLESHGLEINHRNLVFAYDSLQNELELAPFREPIPATIVEPEPTPVPVPTPAISVKARTFVRYRNGARL